MKSKSPFGTQSPKAAIPLAVVLALISVTMALAAAGTLDPTFDGDGKVITDIGGNDGISAMAIQPDGKIVTAGSSDGNFALARYNSDGTLDNNFGINGIVTTEISGVSKGARALALQSDGKIVLGGNTCISSMECDFVLARYNADGSLDTSFDGDGTVITGFDYNGITDNRLYEIGIQTDGKILTVGTTQDCCPLFSLISIARYNIDGSLDTSFDGDGKLVSVHLDYPSALVIQPDGKFILAGTHNTHGGLNILDKIFVARFNSDGTLDTSFNGDGAIFIDVPPQNLSVGNAVALAPNGKIVVVGSVEDIGGYSGSMVAVRLNPNGSLDTTFDGDGIVVTDFGGTQGHQGGAAVAIQLDGKVVAAGGSNYLGTDDFALARYNTNGSLDSTFGEGGKVIISIGNNDGISAIALQADGKIVAGGGSDGDFALARYDGGGLSFPSTAKEDGWVLESTETSNAGGTMNSTNSNFILGDGSLNRQYRAILSFNAKLPETAVITKVTLKIKAAGALVGNNDPFTWGQGLRVDVCKGTFGSEVLQLTDFDFNDAANCKLLVGRFDKSPVDGWYSANLFGASFGKINLAGQTQFRLRFARDDNNDGAADYWRFYSGNYANPNLRPTIIIEYHLP